MENTTSNRITITINGHSTEVERGATILEAANGLSINIPTLCRYRGVTPYGACRVCMVELETQRGPTLVASCSYKIEQNITVQTDTQLVRESRKTILEMLIAQAPDSQELIEFASQYGVESTPLEKKENGKCILCGLCVRVCNDLMGRGAINIFGRGTKRKVDTPFGEPTDQCQSCGACAVVCPTGAIDLAKITQRRQKPHLTAYDQYLTSRPCIDLPHPQATPRVPVIDRENCVHFKTGECGICVQVCQAGAIDYDQEAKTHTLDVGSVILTPGFEAFDATRRGEFGFGFASNVLTNVQFERMLSASGPTSGHIRRPSDGAAPKRLAFIQCVGSRDSGCGNDYCSSVCCMAATKEAILAKEHEPDLDITIFFLDLRAFGKDFDRYANRSANQLGIRYVRSFVSRTYEIPDTKSIRLLHAGPGIEQIEEDFDMVVLSLGLEPSASLRQQAEQMKIALNRWGFAETKELSPLETSRKGVFVAGAFQEPKDIPDTVMQASAAAGKAMAMLASARGTKVSKKVYPPERDVTDEPQRVGVFICHCGSNIGSVVDVAEVVRQSQKLRDVAYAEHNVYTCADDTQGQIKERINEHRLNRIVIGSCTPRTHEPIFRNTLREAGLNPYLLEMANIRDQCSWVHASKPEKATEKSCDLIRMAVARAANLQPLQEETVPVKNAALVIGGGIAGMTTALAMAEQGFPVHLVEKSETLGGTARKVVHTLDGGDVQRLIRNSIDRIEAEPRISVHLQTTVKKVDGHLGSFSSTLDVAGEPHNITHGVAVVATGACERKPCSYGYSQNEKVLTQLDLSDRLQRNELSLPKKPTIAMIQCVEQRSEDSPYCSRVCCTTAIKNSLELKKRYPDARIVVLYRDIRTYGFRESAYRQAREQGVLFVHYDEGNPPKLGANGKIKLDFEEPTLGRQMTIEPDLVVLASGMVPREDRQDLSELLRIPLNADGFFLEAHMKLRPVDFASEGLFLCGTAHAPKFIGETISQANAVAARAASILSKKDMPVGGQTAWVDPNKCISCMTCVHVCPYMAPHVGADNKAEVQNAVCAGCGSCSAECPAKAITLKHYVDTQILSGIDGLLSDEVGVKSVESIYPEQVGIATPKWHKG